MLRTHTAGSLRAEHIGQTVTLTGWVDRRRDHGGVAFIDLRDASGIAQVVIRDEAVAHGLRNEYVLQVTGAVGARPEGNANDHLATGAVVSIESLVRWNHPELGRLLQNDFIRVAEHTGLVNPLTTFVLERSIGDWPESARPDACGLAVNI